MPIVCKRCKEEKPVDKVSRGREICLLCLSKEDAEKAEKARKAHVAKRKAAADEAKKVRDRKRARLNKAKQRARLKLEGEPEPYTAKRLVIKQMEKSDRKRKELADEKQKELARRVLAKRKLIHYIQKFNPGYKAGWVHHDICRRLERFVERVVAGEAPRLMLFLPPRHGKSLIVSDNLISWFLGLFPSMEVIATSYAVSLPIKFSRRIRDRIDSLEHKALFPDLRLSPKSKAAEEWETTKGGAYVAAGVDGGITGKGADLFVIDDPIKDAKEADSETIRKAAWDWYGSTAYTRLSPTSGVLVVQTRWHDDDLSGRLIAQRNELRRQGVPEEEIEDWEVIEYPAEAIHDEWLNADYSITTEPCDEHSLHLRSKGDALHPDRFPIERLRKIKRTLQPRHWSALYQQNPIPDEGMYFVKSMFRYRRSRPPNHEMKIYVAFDLAIGEKEANDYTVGVVGGQDVDDQLHVLDMVRFRGNSFQIVESMLDLCRKYDPQMLGIEKGQLELAIKPLLKRRMRERRITVTLAEGKMALTPISDKSIRARPLQGRMQQGQVLFPDPETNPWVDVAVAELLRFPGGVHDDIVDALAWLMRMVIRESPPKPPKNRQPKSWKDKLPGMGRGGEKDPLAA